MYSSLGPSLPLVLLMLRCCCLACEPCQLLASIGQRYKAPLFRHFPFLPVFPAPESVILTAPQYIPCGPTSSSSSSAQGAPWLPPRHPPSLRHRRQRTQAHHHRRPLIYPSPLLRCIHPTPIPARPSLALSPRPRPRPPPRPLLRPR